VPLHFLGSGSTFFKCNHREKVYLFAANLDGAE